MTVNDAYGKLDWPNTKSNKYRSGKVPMAVCQPSKLTESANKQRTRDMDLSLARHETSSGAEK